MATWLITGAGGWLGGYVLDALVRAPDSGDRIVVLTRGYVVLVIALAATAGGLALDLGIGAYALAAIAATVITVDRPIQSAVLPDLVRSPDELTAANAAAGTVEGAGTLLGPVIAGLLLTVGGPASVFLAATIWSRFTMVTSNRAVANLPAGAWASRVD